MRSSRCSYRLQICDGSFGEGIGAMRQIHSGFPDDFRGVLHVLSRAIRLFLGAMEQGPELATDTLRAVSSCRRRDGQGDGSCYAQPDPPNGETARFR